MRNLGLLEDAFPDGKIVVILRNPIEALHSIYKPDEESIPTGLLTTWRRSGSRKGFGSFARRHSATP